MVHARDPLLANPIMRPAQQGSIVHLSVRSVGDRGASPGSGDVRLADFVAVGRVVECPTELDGNKL